MSATIPPSAARAVGCCYRDGMELVELTPAAARATSTALHLGVVDVARACAIEDLGTDDIAWTATDLARFLMPTPDAAKALWAGVENGRIVGFATIEAPLTDNLQLAEINVLVAPGSRRRGIGGRLFEIAQQRAAALGRRIWLSWAQTTPPNGQSATISAPPGGELLAEHPGVQFLLHHGFALEQIDRISRLDRPVPLDSQAPRAELLPSGYELKTWPTPLPPEWIDSYARLRSRVTIDAPLAGVDAEEEAWSPKRLTRRWAAQAVVGQRELVVAAVDVASGTPVAFTQMFWSDENPEIAEQGFTFVRADHRGHHLGLLVKQAMLGELAKRAPTISRIYTFNASENDHMLAINAQLGYQLCALGGTFQKKT